MDIDRRMLLQATGLAATAGLLAACGSTGSSPDAASPAEGSASEGEATDATDDSAGDATDGAGGATGGLATSDIPVGGGVILAEPAIVVTQPTEGDFKAFTAICPHQGCLVSEVQDNVILCPCHGSLFSAEDGSVLQGPAMTGLSAAGIAVDGGAVVIS